MNGPWIAPIALVVLVGLAGCVGTRKGSGDPEPIVLVGALERSAIEATLPHWVEARDLAEFDRDSAERLAGVGAGAEVTVFLGTWCGDSRRELARLWRAIDEVANAMPFAIEYIGVDREKHAPVERTAGRDIRFVPTLIVLRDGEEVGRIVESAPRGVESDLVDLLSGARTGIVSGRKELAVERQERDSGSR